VLLIAAMTPRKGVSEFLQAIAKLTRRGLPLTATLVGGGEIDRYQQEAQDLGIGDACTFTGWLLPHEVYKCFSGTRVFVLPSYEEGLPMAIIEALRAGVPVISTPVGSIPEVLTHGQDVIFVEPGDVDQLAAEVETQLTDQSANTKIGAGGRATFERAFRIDSYMPRLLELHGAEKKS
jgi:glycosyltransferase involved in cell wall biosynthesis